MSASGPPNPAAAFYSGSRAAQALGATLRAIDSLAPAWGTRAALRLFFTPLPWKFTMRSGLASPWAVTSWPFEGVSIAAYRRGDVEPGRPVVLLVHGWAGGGLQLRAIGDALAAAGFDPVLLDLPAHGRSGGWRSTLPQFTRALHAAMSRLGPLHGVVAHSLGALAALHMAARGLPVQRLVLLAPSAPPAAFLRWFAGSFGLADSVPERMRERIETVEGVPLAEFEPDWLGPRIVQPTLIVHDEADRVAPFAAGQRLAHAMPNASLHATRGLGHRRVMADPAVALEVLRHLR
ncbi:alpha/beta hydrolase [Piscinibacter sp.]|uniref:alpha/beta hydrolase n=1 Tax=Piscinibacter sp. TaxID=1903157 RepID=UPI002C6BE954|nr:alpha/beta fold hydrolase [Albitalea sp.]HUG22995.1 alpha/beta fold hydrolase [Albitalea sp.]